MDLVNSFVFDNDDDEQQCEIRDERSKLFSAACDTWRNCHALTLREIGIEERERALQHQYSALRAREEILEKNFESLRSERSVCRSNMEMLVQSMITYYTLNRSREQAVELREQLVLQREANCAKHTQYSCCSSPSFSSRSHERGIEASSGFITPPPQRKIITVNPGRHDSMFDAVESSSLENDETTTICNNNVVITPSSARGS